MKTLLFAALVLATPFVHAITVECKTHTPLKTSNGDVTAFTLTNIEGDQSKLTSSLPDQNTLEAFSTDENNSLHVKASFSNECDNQYEVSFLSLNFFATKAYGSGAIFGRVTYSSADGVASSAQIFCESK